MKIELKNPFNLPEELIVLHFNQFKVLEKRPDVISERIINYLIDGEDEVLLQEINNILDDILVEAQKLNPTNQTHSWVNLQNYLHPYAEAFSFNKIKDYTQKNTE
jgi:hypothetical protein